MLSHLSSPTSALESVKAGVPLLRGPLYAEQKMNKVHMMRDIGVATEMVGWQQGLVRAAEVEAKVRLVMGVQGKQATPGASVRSQERRLQWLVTVSFRAVLVGHELPPWSCRSKEHSNLSMNKTIGAGCDVLECVLSVW